MNTKDLEKKIKELFSSKGKDVLKIEPTPYRDWGVIVGVFFCGLVLSLGFNIYISIKINGDDFFVAVKNEDSGPVLNKAGLEKVLTEFSIKENTFQKVITEKTPIVDPSL